MSVSVDDGFDAHLPQRADDSAGMITASDLIGTWQLARAGEASGQAFLHFTYTRAFDFIIDGPVRQPLQLYYTIEPPDTIRFRTRPEVEGWTCLLEYDGETLVINAEMGRTVCNRPEPEDIPEWFQASLAEYLARP